MAAPMNTYSITAPGYYGLNTQDSPVDLDNKFSLQANNCIIDEFGRVGSRKGWLPFHQPSSVLGTADIECVGELVTNAGDTIIVGAGNGKFFTVSMAAPFGPHPNMPYAGQLAVPLNNLSELIYEGGGVAPVITQNNWKFTQLNGIAVFWQLGYDTLIFDPAVSTTGYRRLSEKSGAVGPFHQCDVGLSALGRMWAATTPTDTSTLVWSDLLQPHVWFGGTSGSLDVSLVWPGASDTITAMTVHNNFLFIFGKKQIIVYSGADDPTTMTLSDTVVGVGCIARDSLQVTGDDVLFLSATGVRSVMRTIQEKSAPMTTASNNINDDVLKYISTETDFSRIKAAYSPIDSFYLLTFRTSNVTICMDLRHKLPDGSHRPTLWYNIRPRAYWYSYALGILLMGQPGSIATHEGYFDNTAQYRMTWYSTWADFGDPIRKAMLKRLRMTLYGALNQTVVFKWGFDYSTTQSSQPTVIADTAPPSEYAIGEYAIAEYSRNLILKELAIPGRGIGQVLQVGFESQIQGYPISIQKVDIFVKQGRV